MICVVIVILGQWLQWGGPSISKFVDGSRTVPPLESTGEGLVRLLPENLETAVSGFISGGSDEEEATDEGTDAGEEGLNT